jgi:hypothetical protein
MHAAVKQLETTAPLLGAGIAGCEWWVVVALVAVTIFLHGAEPAMRWLDVIDRLRGRAAGPRTDP